jgi:hypothetical protein
MLGQYALRSVERDIDDILTKRFGFKEKKKFLVYIDTDSLVFEMRPVVEKFLAGKSTTEQIKAVEKIAIDIVQEEVNKIMSNICTQLQAYENKINFKLEAVGDKAIFLKKKMYIMRVHSSEGVSYSKPKYKVKGISMVRSSTPAFIRKKMKNSLDIIFDKSEREVQRYISDCREEFDQLRTEEIAFPIGANNLKKWYDPESLYISKTPVQVRASLLYNQKLQEMKLNGLYPEIAEGAKIKFVYLKMPNPIKENVIGWPADTKLPPEFGLRKYIDKDTQFDKTLVNSMQKILSAIDWNAIEQSSLDSFFD